MLNNKGPKIDLCGTPTCISPHIEDRPHAYTLAACGMINN